jgi:hypothetical protein
MVKIALILVATVTLVCGTTISNAQDREWPHAGTPRMEGMRQGEGSHKGDGDRGHGRRPAIIVVGVPVFIGPAYSSYYLAPPLDAYRTLDGFYYYCAEPAGYYPFVQDCLNGWRLVP